MTLCSVKWCNNYTDKRKVKGISFHRFPSDRAIYRKWVKIIRNTRNNFSWQPKTSSVICSLHFREKDFYETKLGRRKLLKEALPVKKLHALKIVVPMSCSEENSPDNLEYGETEVISHQPANCTSETEYKTSTLDCTLILDTNDEVQYKIELDSTSQMCQVCLAVNCKMYPLYSSSLHKLYKSFLDDIMTSDVIIMMCWECTGRLRGAERLKEKARRARTALLELLQNTNQINARSAKSINRHHHRLTSDLKIAPIKYINIDPPLGELEVKQEGCHEKGDVTDDDDSISDAIPLLELIPADRIKADIPRDGTTESRKEELHSTDRKVKTERRKTSRRNGKRKKDGVECRKKSKVKREAAGGRCNGVPGKRAMHRKIEMDRILAAGFRIRKLTPEEQIEEFERKKEDERYLRLYYKCTLCYTGFNEEFKYNNHMARHREEWGKFQCHICKMRTQTLKKLKQHISQSHSEEYKCRLCSMVTKIRTVAFKHLNWHSGTTYKCPLCPAEFTQYSTYMTHRRLKHVSEYVCGLCGYAFLNEKGIYMHKCRMHPFDTSPLEGPHCSVCDVKFVSEEAYTRHLSLSSKHSSDETLMRMRSGTNLQAASKSKMDTEARKAFVKRPITCEVCGVVVLGLRAYAYHFRVQHPNERRVQFPMKQAGMLMCEQCGKKFQNASFLRDHMSVHSGEKKFKCDVCQKLFMKRSNLLLHVKIHSSARREYACEQCARNFSNQSNLYRHKMIHEGQRPYKCTLCEKSFNSSDGLRSHTNHVHLKIPWPARVRSNRRQNDE